MNIAVAVWQNRISNALDFAHKILVLELSGKTVRARREVDFAEPSVPEKVTKLRKLDVDVVICDAISRHMVFMLRSCGIKVVPFVSGDIEQIVEQLKTGKLRPGHRWPEEYEQNTCGRFRCRHRRRNRNASDY